MRHSNNVCRHGGPNQLEVEPKVLVEQVFVLREVFGTDTKDLCKDLGLTASNVWVQLYRARMMLRTCLERGGFGPPQTQ